MKDPARLQAVHDLLRLIESEARPADAMVSAFFRSRRYIGSSDRTAVAEMTYALLRHRARMNWWVEHLVKETGIAPPKPDNFRLHLIAYLALVGKKPPGSIAVLFNGAQYSPQPLGDADKKFLGALKGRTLFHPDMPDSARCECPDWAYEKLKGIFGDRLQKELEAMLAPAPLDIRINPVKTTRDEAQKLLKGEGIVATLTPLSPLGLRITTRVALAQTKTFRDGLIEIQDEGSQMVCLLVDAKPGMRVADFCAGAGGKSLAIAALMENKGQVVAADVLEKRLQRASLRFRRAGLHNISTRALKDERDDWVKRNAGKFDRVLVDAPCSGTGAWRRNPDARWKRLGPGLEELVPLQAHILESAARLVKAGGRLIYATCSLLHEENERQIEDFLKNHTDFTSYGERLKLTPAQNGTDGFFAVILSKK